MLMCTQYRSTKGVIRNYVWYMQTPDALLIIFIEPPISGVVVNSNI